MKTQEITIRVTPDAASVYRSASEATRRKLDALLSLRLSETSRPSPSIEKNMMEATKEARESGLSSEILEGILGE